MRREFLNQVLFWNALDLERKLAEFQCYYNAARSHASLEGHTPLTFAKGPRAVPADFNHVRWVSHCRDLVQLPRLTTNSRRTGGSPQGRPPLESSSIRTSCCGTHSCGRPTKEW